MKKEVYWWISFAETGKNLGVVIAKGSSIEECTTKCTELGCNPGGEALGMPFELSALRHMPKVYNWILTVEKYKLFQTEELPAFLQAERLSALEADGFDTSGIADFVCKECNTRFKIGEEHIHKQH